MRQLDAGDRRQGKNHRVDERPEDIGRIALRAMRRAEVGDVEHHPKQRQAGERGELPQDAPLDCDSGGGQTFSRDFEGPAKGADEPRHYRAADDEGGEQLSHVRHNGQHAVAGQEVHKKQVGDDHRSGVDEQVGSRGM